MTMLNVQVQRGQHLQRTGCVVQETAGGGSAEARDHRLACAAHAAGSVTENYDLSHSDWV